MVVFIRPAAELRKANSMLVYSSANNLLATYCSSITTELIKLAVEHKHLCWNLKKGASLSVATKLFGAQSIVPAALNILVWSVSLRSLVH